MENRCLFLPPSTLAARLQDGSLDVALVSVTEALLKPGFQIIDDVAIGSDGPVFSVFLAHRIPIETVQCVHLDPASCTSVSLLKILLAERGIYPEVIPLTSYDQASAVDAVLLIGNPAIEFARSPFSYTRLDLGVEWQRQTNLPFIYAVWAVRDAVATPALATELRQVAAQGVARIPHIIEERTDFDADFRRAYLGGHIRYTLGPREKAGLERFRHLLEHHTGRFTYPPRFF